MNRGMRVLLISLFFFVLTPSPKSEAVTALEVKTHARAQRLWEDPQWPRLLHYHTAVWSRRFEGQPDDPKFFLAPDGKQNAQSELEATIDGVFNPSLRVRCQFPARWRFLAKHLGLSEKDIPAQTCNEFNEWYKKTSPQSATLVFSSYFLNSPSSTFGHSLIRLNKSPHSASGQRFELLDYGINFAASNTTSNPIVYAFNGFVGFFKGMFSAIPYYYKVREYSDFETRDLWEYDLNLTPEEVQTLAEHFWELGSTYFDYFYLTENCSFHMLTALEAAAPRLNLVDKIPFWIIPADTIKAVTRTPDLVKKINFRPSLWTQFQARLDRLNTQEEHLALDHILESRQLNDLPETKLDDASKSRVIDAAMDYIDFKYGRELVAEDREILDWKQRFLVARSRLPAAAPLNIPTPEISAPHSSHDSLRVGLHYFGTNKNSFWEPAVRFALHDLADPTQGYPPTAKIEFLHFRFRYNETSNQFLLQQGLLFSVDSLSPWQHFQKNVSWRMELGIERVDDRRCVGCLPVVARGAAGFTWNILENPMISHYVLVEGAVHYSSEFPDADASATLTPLTGLRMQAKENLVMHAELRLPKIYYRDMPDYREGKLNLRYAFEKAWAVDLAQLWQPSQNHFGIGLYHYF